MEKYLKNFKYRLALSFITLIMVPCEFVLSVLFVLFTILFAIAFTPIYFIIWLLTGFSCFDWFFDKISGTKLDKYMMEFNPTYFSRKLERKIKNEAKKY